MRISKDNYKNNILNNYYMLDVWAKCFMGIILFYYKKIAKKLWDLPEESHNILLKT